MKILKIVGIALISLVALFLIAAALTPKTYTVSVAETIEAPAAVVKDYVRILDNQKHYSIWVMEDPDLSPLITGEDGTVGAQQYWNSDNKNVGEGYQTITGLTDSRMDVDLKFIRPWEGEAKAATLYEAITPNQTLVTSEFYGNDPYPGNLMGYWLGRSMIAKAQQENLANLKRILER
ncbi:MAG: SRPBCC family protein [Bacteroidia bacterium]